MKNSRKTPQELGTELEHYGRFYVIIHRPETSQEPRIIEALNRIACLDVSTSYPLLLYLFDRHDAGVLSLEDFLASLLALESFVIRRIVCGESARAYARWFPADVHDLKSNRDDVLTALLTFLHNKGWTSDEQFKEALLKFELYRREPQKCRLILEELEKLYKHKEPVNLATQNIEIEHVMPSTLSEEWRRMLGDEWQRVHDTYLHTLGNLTLSGYNRELYNKPFLEKKIRLAESNLELNKYFASIDVWDESAIVARGKKLAEEVARIWGRFQP